MAITTETLYRKLYDNLESKGYNPTAEDATTGKKVVPEEADFLEMDVELDKGTTPVTLTVEKVNDRFSLTVYFTDEAKENATDDWYDILKDLRYTARSSGIKNFVLRNRNHLGPDMQKRTYMKKQEQIAEGYYPMGKKGSYNDSIPSVKIVIEHTRQIEEGEQRFRNINRIFLENEQGERILAPTTRPGIAKVYARVIAEGDLPHGERWNHVNSLVEEYSKMAGFVRATKGKQFNESTQKLVESGVAHYQTLRETLSRMIGHKGYNTYFESWTPPLMEDDTDTSNLNELFVQETLDPRIESVMPILSKLQKNISEMSEVSELAEWADSLLEGGDGGEASEEPVEQIEESPGAETLAHNQSTEEKRLQALDLDEEESLSSNNPGAIPEDDLEEDFGTTAAVLGGAALGAKLGKTVGIYRSAKGDEEAGLAKPRGAIERLKGSWKGLAHPKYDDDGEVHKINPKYRYEEDTQFHEEVDTGEADARKSVKSEPKGDWDKDFREKLKQYTKELEQRQKEDEVEEGQQWPDTSNSLTKRSAVVTDLKGAPSKAGRGSGMTVATRVDPTITSTTVKRKDSDKPIPSFLQKEEELEEDQFAGDFKTGPEGQWRNKGPKANKPATVGDLVGASESVDSQEAMLEGQDDLDAILRIIRK